MAQVGDDLYSASYGDAGEGQAKAFVKEVDKKTKFGRSGRIADTRMITHDRLEARAAKPIPWHVSKDDRMEADEVKETLKALHHAYGITGASHAHMEAFLDALCFCHTVNSGSVLQPGRSVMIVGGSRFGYIVTLQVLDSNLRRFYRALANEVADVNKKILRGAKDTNDIEAQERYQWLMQVASERGLLRHPYLAHDSSDACWDLNAAEQSALKASKAGVFSSIVNRADAFALPRLSHAATDDSTTIYSAAAPRESGAATK